MPAKGGVTVSEEGAVPSLAQLVPTTYEPFQPWYGRQTPLMKALPSCNSEARLLFWFKPVEVLQMTLMVARAKPWNEQRTSLDIEHFNFQGTGIGCG